MEHIIFVAGMIPHGKEAEVLGKSKVFPPTAANMRQWSIASGLSQRPDIDFSAVNCAFVGTYPREYGDLLIRKAQWNERGIRASEVGYVNLFGVRSVMRAALIYDELCKKIRQIPADDRIDIIVYSMTHPFVDAARKAKKKFSDRDIRFCLYVPVLPMYFDETAKKRGAAYRVLKKYDCRSMVEKCLPAVDCFVLHTEQMTDVINKAKKPYAVIEGIVSDRDVENTAPSVLGDEPVGESGIKRIVYTGRTDANGGILSLIAAFSHLRGAEYSLEIYGSGDADNAIRSAAARDQRIRFHGTVKRLVALAAQRGASVLVDPQTPNDPCAEYSFPVKTIEYLLSARPVIMHRLPGLPIDYLSHLSFFSSTDPEIMARELRLLADLDPSEQYRIGQEGRRFMIEEKNERSAARRIIELLRRS